VSEPEPNPPCKLCGAHTPLQNSHILPEFVYVPIYDEKHKGLVVDPLAPDIRRSLRRRRKSDENGG
jgi:hypothetical protein